MGSWNKFFLKNYVFFINLLFFIPACSFAGSLPAANDINSLAENANKTFNDFMQQSFMLRMSYEYNGKFLTSNHKDQLHNLAKKASPQLHQITEKQKQLKNIIEQYQGNDWEQLYGKTGLWKKLFTDIYSTNWGKSQVDFYLALTYEPSKQIEILNSILNELDFMDKKINWPQLKLLKGKALTLLAKTDSFYKIKALKQLDWFKSQSYPSLSFQAEIEKAKLTGHVESRLLDYYVKTLKQKSLDGNVELILPLAFTGKKIIDPNAFEQTVNFWPKTKYVLGSLILERLSFEIDFDKPHSKNLEQINLFDAELAAVAVSRDNTQNHKKFLENLIKLERFQTPLILYVAAVKFADSNPEKAVKLLIESSKKQQSEQNKLLEIPPSQIAKQAAQLAYNLFSEDSQYCFTSLIAFENYQKIADNQIDEEIEYLYTTVLADCKEARKSKQLLEKIANYPTAKYRNHAKLDLIKESIKHNSQKTHTIPPNEHTNHTQQIKTIKQLNNLIDDCIRQNKTDDPVLTQAVTIYSKFLLKSNDTTSANKVLIVLDKINIINKPDLNILKSAALQQLGKLDESAKYMLLATEPNDCNTAGHALELLSDIILEIDQLSEQLDDFPGMIHNCNKIAKHSFNCHQEPHINLILAEITIFAANKENLSNVEKLLNTLDHDKLPNPVDLLRCKARLLTEQGKFENAAKIWAQIANDENQRSASANQRSYKWWRAKFYELSCWSKSQNADVEKIAHNIDILENSFSDIPRFWAKKLRLLKEHISEPQSNITK